MIGIYKITSPNGRIYVGQSKNIEKRIKCYKSLNCKGQKLLYRSLLKYGVDKHKFEIIIECSELFPSLQNLEINCQKNDSKLIKTSFL